MSKPRQTSKVSVAIIGTGARGRWYADLLANNERATLVACAEPQTERRELFAERYNIAPEQCFDSWQSLAAAGKIADAVIITTSDQQHWQPAIGFADLGYDLLLEKPMATEEAHALAILEAVTRNDVKLMVCHVLRYSTYTKTIKHLIASGRLGTIASIEHLEPVGWWHQAHSYVRGNWRTEATSAPMLLSKSSHDIDWINYIVGKPARKVASFGSLLHFKPENKPQGASDRCVSCTFKDTCTYSAPHIYERFLDDESGRRWPLGVLTDDPTHEGLQRALETGPYGECVFNGHNDVVDHQVVSIEYEGGTTASFTMVGFSELGFRKTRVFGTLGCLEGDGQTITIQDFHSGTTEIIELQTDGSASAADGHGGADHDMIETFLTMLTTDTPDTRANAYESLASHQLVWAAERARRSDTVVTL